MMKALLLGAACLASNVGGVAAQNACSDGGGTCDGTAGYVDSAASTTVMCDVEGSTSTCEVGGADDDYANGGACCPAASCPLGTTGNDAATGCVTDAGYTGGIVAVAPDVDAAGYTTDVLPCAAGTYKAAVGTHACGPCLTLCEDGIAGADAYTVCPEASVHDSTSLGGSCEYTSLFSLIEDNSATADLLNNLATANYGAADLCAERETLLRCRTVNDALRSAELRIDSACVGR